MNERAPANRSSFNRRTMMKGLIAGSMSAVAARLLGRLPSAQAAPDEIRRLIVMVAPNDSMFRQYWAPKNDSGDAVEVGTRGVPLTGFSGNLEPLSPHASRIRLIGDVVNQAIRDHNWHSDGGHPGLMWLLTGVPTTPRTPTSVKFDELAGGPSVDKYIASKLGVGSMNVGVGTKGSDTAYNVSYPDAKQVAVPFADPLDTYDDLFANFTVDAAEFETRKLRRATVVDVVSKDLQSLAPRLPTADRQKLEQHLSELHALEQKLGDKQSLACAEVPPSPAEIDTGKSGNLPEIGRSQIDVMVQGLACDLRRVACLQYGDAFYLHPNSSYDWPTEDVYTTQNEHDVSHNWMDDSAIGGQRKSIEKFYAGQLRYLMDKLESVDEGNGKTMLDSTLIVYGRPMGNTYHAQTEHLFVLAGGSKFVKGGQFDSIEVPHNQLLAGICRAMGLSDESFGHPDYPGYIDFAS